MLNLVVSLLTCLPDSVAHTVGTQSSHHAQLLKGRLVLPLLGELLLLRALALHKLLPAFGRALDVTVQVSEVLHRGQRLPMKQRGAIQNSFDREYVYSVMLFNCHQGNILSVKRYLSLSKLCIQLYFHMLFELFFIRTILDWFTVLCIFSRSGWS